MAERFVYTEKATGSRPVRVIRIIMSLIFPLIFLLAELAMAEDSSGNVEEILRNEHLLTQAQLEAIEHEIKSTQPLTSHLLPITALAQQYNTADITPNINYDEQRGFVRSASFLCGKYSSLRKVRGDGNCYYRAFLYAICERLLSIRLDRQNDDDDDYAEFRRLKRTVVESLKWICRHGYDEYTIDMFHEELVDLFDFIERASPETSSNPTKVEVAAQSENVMQQLHSKLNEENAVSLRYQTTNRMNSYLDCNPAFNQTSLKLILDLLCNIYYSYPDLRLLYLVHARNGGGADEIESRSIPSVRYGGGLPRRFIVLLKGGRADG